MHRLARHRLEILVGLSCLALLGYFGWQGFYGPRSIHYRDQLTLQYAQLSADLAAVGNRRKALEARVQQMRPESVDADLVDEMARKLLNMGKATDFVVRLPE
ncbi:MAG: septum formation initiator family protein [Alphaproteobacteria bacterium]|nr:septum formation initiator family protein [Alphaproteobacteria bacterium]